MITHRSIPLQRVVRPLLVYTIKHAFSTPTTPPPQPQSGTVTSAPALKLGELIEEWRAGQWKTPPSNETLLQVLATGVAASPSQIVDLLRLTAKHTPLPLTTYLLAMRLSGNATAVYSVLKGDNKLAAAPYTYYNIFKDLIEKVQATAVWDLLYEVEKLSIELNVPTRLMLILFCCRMQEYERVTTLYEKLPSSAILQVNNFYSVIVAYGERNQPEKVYEVYRRAKETNSIPLNVYNGTLRYLLSLPRRAEEVIQHRIDEGPELDATFLRHMLTVYGNLNNVEKMMWVLNKLHANGWLRPWHCQAIFSHLTYKEHTNFAIEVLAKMRQCNYVPTAANYNLVVGLCEKARELLKAADILTEMRSKNIIPSYAVRCNLITLLAHNHVDQAITMIDSMLADRVLPSVAAATAVLKKLVDSDSARAREFSSRMANVGIDLSHVLQKGAPAQARVSLSSLGRATNSNPTSTSTPGKPFVALSFLSNSTKT